MSDFEAVLKRMRNDLHWFTTKLMRFQPTNQQLELLDAVQNAQNGNGSNWIAVKSGQGPGKTTVSGIVALWRTIRSPGALTITTAPTMRQCVDVWLAELSRSVKGADPFIASLIEITKTKVIVAGRSDWGIRLVAAKKEENAQGYHQKNMTVICEEASGIPTKIITQYKGTLSNPDALFLMIGNPNSRDSAFFESFYGTQNKRWAKLTFNAEDTARDYPDIVNPQRNLDLEEEFGRESDVYRVRVLGEFPSSDPNCVISSDWVLDAFRPEYKLIHSTIPSEQIGRPAKSFGIDFARFGGNENVTVARLGNSVEDIWRKSRVEPSAAIMKATEWQANYLWKDQDCVYIVDAGGIGQGIVGSLYDNNKRVYEFNSGAVPFSSFYANKYTEAWFGLAKLLKARQIYLPKDSLLLNQLSTRRYVLNKKGKLILETKDEYEKRGFESPDRADAVVYAFYDPALASSGLVTKQEVMDEMSRLRH